MENLQTIYRKQVVTWLTICGFLVFCMIIVGGATRLTHSGLSIVEWEPIVGTIPPITNTDWNQVFDEYKGSPEYQLVNFGMSLDEFKVIFWWEYFHRLLGRLIGLVFFLPFLYFLLRRRLNSELTTRLLGIFALGGLQGAMGWYMVASGLVDDPNVSQYRLTAHLGIAFLIFGAITWTTLSVIYPSKTNISIPVKSMYKLSVIVSFIIFLMVLSGGFVAGLRAGLIYNTFPLKRCIDSHKESIFFTFRAPHNSNSSWCIYAHVTCTHRSRSCTSGCGFIAIHYEPCGNTINDIPQRYALKTLQQSLLHTQK